MKRRTLDRIGLVYFVQPGRAQLRRQGGGRIDSCREFSRAAFQTTDSKGIIYAQIFHNVRFPSSDTEETILSRSKRSKSQSCQTEQLGAELAEDDADGGERAGAEYQHGQAFVERRRRGGQLDRHDEGQPARHEVVEGAAHRCADHGAFGRRGSESPVQHRYRQQSERTLLRDPAENAHRQHDYEAADDKLQRPCTLPIRSLETSTKPSEAAVIPIRV